MRIDFNELDIMTVQEMNGGEGSVEAQMAVNEVGRFVYCRIRPGSSIGMHEQASGNDINFVVSGIGHAICDGKREELREGICHIAPAGSSHSIVNDGDSDLILLTAVI